MADRSSITTPLLIILWYLVSSSITILINYPYRPFPSDEFMSYSHVLTGFGWLRSDSEVLMNSPLHIYSLQPMRLLASILGLERLQTFLLTAALSINGIALLIGLTIYTATRRVLISAGAMLLFLVSAWPQSYLHFYTYAPLVGLYMMASMYFFTRYYIENSDNIWLVRMSGFFAGLFFLSSPSAKLTAVVLLASYILLIHSSKQKESQNLYFYLISSTLLPIIILLPQFLGPLAAHLNRNVTGGTGVECLQKYGFLPASPFFSYFHQLGVYSPVLLVFLLFALFVTLFKWKIILQQGRQGRLLLVLMGTIVLHSIVIDLLPFTKHGRAQFPLLPLSIVASFLLCAILPVARKTGTLLVIIFILIAVPLEISTSARTWQVRRTAPNRLAQLQKNTIFLVLKNDPHHEFIVDWLTGSNVHPVDPANIHNLIQSSARPVALIVGPTGPNSGKSILNGSLMDDFYFTMPPGISTIKPEVIKLPYYAYYPFFMLEEENSQCFFFRRQTPDYRSAESQLTVYFWPAPSLAPGQDRKDKTT